MAELAVVQGIFVDIPDGAKRFTLLNAATQKVKDMGATLTQKVEMWLSSEMTLEIRRRFVQTCCTDNL